jgi:ABC-type Fe3+-hydroxamate transport system substrate-binding protein
MTSLANRGRVPRFLFVLVLLAACAREEGRTTVQDDLGRPVALAHRRVERIIAIAPNVTEMIFALGSEGKLVGVDDNSNFPAAAKKLPRVGGMEPNIEKIAALKPDLVLASSQGNQPTLARALGAIGVPLYVVKSDRVDEIASAMERLGALLDSPRKDAPRALHAAVDAQRRTRARKPRVLFAVWTDPLYVAGRKNFTDDLFTLTGANNAVEADGWPQYSLESLVAKPPDIILYPRGAVTPEQIAALLARAPGVRSRVEALNEDVFQRPGPRVGEAAAALNAILDKWERGSN